MFARLTTFQVPPDQIDEQIRFFHQRGPVLREFGGFRHAYLLIDRQGGRARTVTLWETRADLRASMAVGKQLIAENALAVGGAASEPEVYEVVEDLDWDIIHARPDFRG
jgi:heme-degrading monooxygenase HmoA